MAGPIWRRFGMVVVIVAALASSAHAGAIAEMFVFGDSLSGTGNVLNRTNAFSAFGVTPRPTTPWYDTGRWTNGPSNDGSNTTPPRTKETAFGGVWHERLADKLNIPRATNSLAGGNNWAYGGATTGTGTFSALTLRNVRNQVDTFLADTPQFNDMQLYAMWGGGNDVRDAANAANATVNTIKAAASAALANMKGSIDALAAAGGKRFLWPNLPPLEKTPEGAGLDDTQKDGLKQASELFRDQQGAAVAMLLNTHANIDIFVLDVHTQFRQIEANPASFGYTNITGGIITATDFGAQTFGATANFPTTQIDADKYLFWDQVHPTARTHDLIGMAAFAVVPEPSVFVMVGSLSLVFGAVLLTARCKRITLRNADPKRPARIKGANANKGDGSH